MVSEDQNAPPALVWVKVTTDDTGVRVDVAAEPHATEFRSGLAGEWVPYVPLATRDDESP